VDLHAATVVFDETQIPEPVQEKADARARRADHLGKRLLAHLHNHRKRLGLLRTSPDGCRDVAETLRDAAND
jgi:hypothetical protein